MSAKTVSIEDRMDGEFRHNLRRCGKLTDAERSFLAFVASYSHGCKISYAEIAYQLVWSTRKVERVVQGLVAYGLLARTYRCGKKVTLKIAPARVQTEFARAHARPPLNKKTMSDPTPVAEEGTDTGDGVTRHQWRNDPTPMAGPMLESSLERNLESDVAEGTGVPKGLVPSRGCLGEVARLLRVAKQARVGT